MPTAASPLFPGALDRWRDGDRPLRDYVESAAADLGGDQLAGTAARALRRVAALAASPDPAERLAGVLAVDELVDARALGEPSARVPAFAAHLDHALATAGDDATLGAAADVYGHLARGGGAAAAEAVEAAVRRCLDWLRSDARSGDRGDRRLAAALALRALAESAPAVFNVHVRPFVDAVWAGLRDPRAPVRAASAAALRACLVLVEARETRYRVQWYHRLFEESRRGLDAPGAPPEAVLGSLAALRELLAHTGEFMLARHREVAAAALAFAASRDPSLRSAALGLAPALAAFAPERFADAYAARFLEFCAASLAATGERLAAFAALGATARALASAGVASGLEASLPAAAAAIADALAAARAAARAGGVAAARPQAAGRVAPPVAAALRCMGDLAAAMGPAWAPHAAALLPAAAATGLSPPLVDALTATATSLPELAPAVQACLLDLLAGVLGRRGAAGGDRPPAAGPGPPPTGAAVRLALRTLASVDLGPGPALLRFVRRAAVPLLDDADAGTRRAAASACAAAARRAAALVVAAPPGAPTPPPAAVRDGEAVVNRLLRAAATDVSPSVRRAALAALAAAPELDPALAQAETLLPLFVCLNDESGPVRGAALALAGRLADVNPAYVLPALRRHLMQLLADLDAASDGRRREEAARLLGGLAAAAPRLVRPYAGAVLRTLVARMASPPPLPPPAAGGGDSERDAPDGAAAAAAAASSAAAAGGALPALLATAGELARVAGPDLAPHVGDLLPLVVDAIAVGGPGGERRTAAVATLGQIVESTGLAMTPYTDFPHLLGLLLHTLADGPSAGRPAVLRVLGALGALDPHAHKVACAGLSGEGKLEAEGVRPQRPGGAPGGGGGANGSLTGAGPTASAAAYGAAAPATVAGTLGGAGFDAASELLPAGGLAAAGDDYYAAVALRALLRALRDGGLAHARGRVARALVYVLGALRGAAVPYLPTVVPALLATVRAGDEGLADYVLGALAGLVGGLRAHLRRWLPDLLAAAADAWRAPGGRLLPRAIALHAALAAAMGDDVKPHLPDLLPRYAALFADAERGGDAGLVPPALGVLEALGPALEGYLPLLLPSVLRLVAPSGQGPPLAVRRQALASLARLLPRLDAAPHAASVLHPILRLADAGPSELLPDAADAFVALAPCLGDATRLFAPSFGAALARRAARSPAFDRLAAALAAPAPPCVPDDGEAVPAADFGESDPPGGWGGGGEADGEADAPPERHAVCEASLRRAWESSQRSTADDWDEWARRFAVELLRQSPSPALRAAAPLAQAQPAVARELFPAAFVSCWSELSPGAQDALVRSLEAALASPSIPAETVTALLDLAEFMEHDDRPLPLDTRTLGALAERCHAFAKALHYKEAEFEAAPRSAVEALISVNNHLRQPEAAVGVLKLAQRDLHMELKESWHEKLQRWDDALAAYEARGAAAPPGSAAASDAAAGRLRCLAALARWDDLSLGCAASWAAAGPAGRRELAPLASLAAWHMGRWDDMAVYAGELTGRGATPSSSASFLGAVLAVHAGDWLAARARVADARGALGAELAALVRESYERAYSDVVRAQQLTELDEVIDYSLAARRAGAAARGAAGAGARDALLAPHPTSPPLAADDRRPLILSMWRARLAGVQRNVEVWQALLSVRSLVLPMADDARTWVKFAALCRKSGRIDQGRRVLVQLLRHDPAREAGMAAGELGALTLDPGPPLVRFAYCKHEWATAPDAAARAAALARLSALADDVCPRGGAWPPPSDAPPAEHAGADRDGHRAPLAARVSLRLGTWTWSATPATALDDGVVADVLARLELATARAPDWARAWHAWALFNVQAMEHYAKFDVAAAARHAAPAVRGFFASVAVGVGDARAPRGAHLQDVLRLLTLWFNHGAQPDVRDALHEGFGHVAVDTWLGVLPQIIARIHTRQDTVRGLIHTLLVAVGRSHPQALMYPLLVACKSQSPFRRAAAASVVDAVRAHAATLVDQAQLVSRELIRIAILWHEMWHEALEEASRQVGREEMRGREGEDARATPTTHHPSLFFSPVLWRVQRGRHARHPAPPARDDGARGADDAQRGRLCAGVRARARGSARVVPKVPRES